MMALNWRLGKGVSIQEIISQRFLFQWGAWAYDNHPLIYERVKPADDLQNVELEMSTLWVQVHALPAGLMSDAVARGIGTKLGTFIESDPNNYSGAWRPYMRLRVKLDVRKSLKQMLKLKT